MVKRVICILAFGLIASSALAQEVDTTTVDITGNIIDEKSQEPVEAQIKYESLPYGSKIGVFKGDSFNFTIARGTDMLLAVDAEGYAPYRTTLKTKDSLIINKTIELKPTGVNQLITLEKLIFALGKDDISEESHEELDELVSMLRSNPEMKIQLEGHTDFRGNDKLNMKLSEDRVKAVRDYLVKSGIDKDRIKTKAFGGTQPLSRESDAHLSPPPPVRPRDHRSRFSTTAGKWRATRP